MPGARLHRARLGLLALLLLAGWAGLVYRLVQIQILQSGRFRVRAEQQHLREVVLVPERGQILDRRGRLLASDRLLHTVGVHPRLVKDTERVAETLQTLLGESRTHWKREIARHNGFFFVARQAELQEEPPPGHLLPEGLEIVEAYRRTYPMGRLAGQVLGYVGVEGRGLEGVELAHNAQLQGRAGRLIQQVDATGAPIPGREVVREEPVDGMTVRLTLDAVIQEVVEEELRSGVERSQARSGMAVAMDPRTGAILAMASWPDFDPNGPENVPPGMRRNRTITDPFEPGSVLKIVTFAAALDARRYTPQDTIDGGDGVIQVVGSEIRDTRAHGKMSFGEVLQYSSNVGTVKIARAVGENRMYRYARDYGFGHLTGVDLPGESGGVLRRLTEWRGPALESLSIGYGLSVTALQLATAYAAVANGGRLLRPYLVSRVSDPDGSAVQKGTPQVIRRVMHEETSAILRGYLREAVVGGTGDRAAVSGLDVAGKTGTARKATSGGYERGAYISSFCGFLPAGDPRFLLFVVVDEPANQYYAREVAAPIFARSVQRLMSHPEHPLDGVQSFTHAVAARPDPIVPDLRRWPAAEAGRALTRRGLRVRYVGQGPAVLAQEPAPLTPLAEGKVVVLHLAAAAEQDEVRRIPDLRGQTLREAAAAASVLGLELSAEGSGIVRSQDPAPGTVVAGRQGITVRATGPGRDE